MGLYDLVTQTAGSAPVAPRRLPPNMRLKLAALVSKEAYVP